MVASRKYKYRHAWIGYLMVLPSFVILSIFVIYPLFLAIVKSFLNSDTKKFVMFDNYKYILNMSSFTKSFDNMLYIVPIVVVSMIVLSFLFAHILKKLTTAANSVVKTLIYIPFLLSGITCSIIFLFITNYGGGLISSILFKLDMDAISFTQDPFYARLAIIVPTVWLGIGYNTIIMYAGLINVPKAYYEAASIDGAGKFRQMIYITLPNMTKYIVLLLIGLVTATLQMFEIPLMMTGGGPLEQTLTPVFFLYVNHRGDRPENVILAGAMLVMVLISSVNAIVYKVIRSARSEDA